MLSNLLTCNQQLAYPLLEAHGPVERLHRMAASGIRVQIVYELTAADDQDAFSAQCRQPFANFVMKLRRLRFIAAELP